MDNFGNKKSFFYVLSSLDIEMYEKKSSNVAIQSVKDSRGKAVDLKRNFELAFFQDSSELLEAIKKAKASLVEEIFKSLVLIVALISIACLALFLLLVQRTAKNMSKQIIDIYETLHKIVNLKSKVELSYKPACEEVNELQKAFNKFAKTINISKKNVREGKEYEALLEYAQAFHIFKEFNNIRQMGICKQNMGAIRFKINELKSAHFRFSESVWYLKKELADEFIKEDEEYTVEFDSMPITISNDILSFREKKDAILLLAFRIFQKGLTEFMLLQ